jgi:hypothetical protein
VPAKGATLFRDAPARPLHQQEQRQYRAALQVEHSGDLQVGFGRKHRKVVAGQNERRGEVGQRRRE